MRDIQTDQIQMLYGHRSEKGETTLRSLGLEQPCFETMGVMMAFIASIYSETIFRHNE